MQGTRHDIEPMRQRGKRNHQKVSPSAGASACMGKQAYPTRGEAVIVAQNQRRFGKGTDAYACLACGKWHTGRNDFRVRDRL